MSADQVSTDTQMVTRQRIEELTEEIQRCSVPLHQLRTAIGQVLVGQQTLVDRMLICLLAQGHLLIEGVPGLAKTTAVACLAKALDTGFQRLQFTPDLLPADLLGTLIYRPQDGQFAVQRGPIFSNLILADEINRAPAKVQSALLEAMQERQVTIGQETFALPDPFLVMATQNPIEQEGTYPLPEAQLDRFMLKTIVTYPDRDEEIEILDRMSRTRPNLTIQPATSPEHLVAARALIDQVYVDPKVRDYIVDLVLATRFPARYAVPIDDLLQYGASPRATINLTLTAKTHAFLQGRGYVVPQDVKEMALDVLRHRVIITYEAEAENKTSDDVVRALLAHVPVP